MRFYNQRAVAALALFCTVLPVASAPATASGSGGCTGVAIAPADAPSLAAIVSHHPAQTTFCLAPGIYRLTATIRPAAGDVFVGSGSGAGGTAVRGDAVLAGWRAAGGLYVHVGGVWSRPLTGRCAVGTACRYRDDVYRNGGFLRRVLPPCTAERVTGGAYCIDYARNSVYLHDRPSAAVISYSRVSAAFRRAAGVHLRHMAITHFSSPAQGAAVTVGSSSVADDLAVAYNHGGGIKLVGTDPIVRNSRLYENGQVGASGGRSVGALFARNQVYLNNALNFDASWDAGGAKFANTLNAMVRGNHFSDNRGSGLWFDVDNSGAAISHNLSDHNRVDGGGGDGMRIEISCNATITSNRLLANARHGISIANSHEITFGVPGAGNTVADNAASAVWVTGNGRVEGPRPLCHPDGGTYPDTNDVVQDNSIGLPVGKIVGFAISNGAVPTGSRFLANTYAPASGCSARLWRTVVGRKLAFDAWQSTGQDSATAGTCARPRASTY